MTELTSLWHGVINVRPLHKPMREIAAEVAQAHGLTAADLMVRTHAHKIAHARQEAMWRMRQETPNSQPMIAAFFGLKDHTTVIHACKAVERRRQA